MPHITINKSRLIIDGKLYCRHFLSSSGKAVGIPTGVYIRYADDKGRGRCYSPANKITSRFWDKHSCEVALLEVIELHLKKAGNGARTYNNIRVRERNNFEGVHTPPGINLKLNKAKASVVIMVSYYCPKKMGFRAKSTYCGNLDNWRDLFEIKLAEVVKLREDSLRYYKQLTTLPQSK